MKISPHTSRVYIDRDQICANYRLLAEMLAAEGHTQSAAVSMSDRFGGRMSFAWPPMLAVVKADAYGHGHIQVSQALMEKEGVTVFASGSVSEAAELRVGLEETTGGQAQGKATLPLIVSLLGLIGPEDVALCVEYGIVPVIHSFEQLPLLQALKRPLPVAIKCNSGMSRLGFGLDDMPRLLERLRDIPLVAPALALSHLACADSADGAENIRHQASIFSRMLAALRGVWPNIAASLCNSAGILQAATATGIVGKHICRAGISLYGCNPLYGTDFSSPAANSLKPAMSVSSPIIAVRYLAPGEALGYGHTFVATRHMRVGIIAAGYADMLARSLSGNAFFCAGDVRVPVLGRISMQMTALDLTEAPDLGVNDLVWLLGGPHEHAVTPEELAEVWGTITYEVFCLLGTNPRTYEL